MKTLIGSLITLLLILWSGYMEAQETNQFNFVNSSYTLDAFNVKSVEYYAPVYRESLMMEMKILYKDSTSITFLVRPREKRINDTWDIYNLDKGFRYRCQTKFPNYSTNLDFYLYNRYVTSEGIFY